MVLVRQLSCAMWAYHGLRHRLRPCRGVSLGASDRPWVIDIFAGPRANDHDPKLRGCGLRWLGLEVKTAVVSLIP